MIRKLHFLRVGFVFVATFLGASSVWATSISSEMEEEQYKRGVTLRKQEAYEQAQAFFLPLAEMGNIKAAHNYAMCAYHLGDEEEAYKWFKFASDKGLAASSRNLEKLNLLHLMLPDETLTLIVSNLTLDELAQFALSSRRNHAIFIDLITHTNFLTSQEPHARDFMSIFSNVVFEPTPDAIRLQFLNKSQEGDVEIHFRDPEHLRNVVDKTPLVEVPKSSRVYFVHDENVNNGQEILASAGDLTAVLFINVIGDEPITPHGEATLPLKHMQLPRKSDINHITVTSSGEHKVKLESGKLKTYEDGTALAAGIEDFDTDLLTIRTRDAITLLERRRSGRMESPQLYPTLDKLCPAALILSGPSLRIEQEDYIASATNEPIFYIGDSMTTLQTVLDDLPEFGDSITCISSTLGASGVYSLGPLKAQKAFKLLSDESISITGSVWLPDYTLSIYTCKNLYTVRTKVLVGGPWKIRASHMHRGTFDRNHPPAGMPNEHCQKIIEFWDDLNSIGRLPPM